MTPILLARWKCFQLFSWHKYADRMGYVVVREFSEKISGANKVEEREALVDKRTFDAVQEVLDGKKKETPKMGKTGTTSTSMYVQMR